MDILRRIGLSFAILIFSLSISLAALFISLHFVIDTPMPLKQALATSGIYGLPVQDTLISEMSESSLPATDPNVQQALTKAFPPTFLQDTSEKTIDSIYDWIHGAVATPGFSIDLTEIKVNFANNIATYAQQRLDTLPACGQFTAPPTTAAELLSLTCMPRGVSSGTLANAVRQEALRISLLSENNTINTATLKDSKGQPITDQLAGAPQFHDYYKISLYLLPFLALLCAIAILFWSTSKRAGVKRIAWLLLTAGATAVVFAIVEVWILQAAASILVPGSASPMVQDKLVEAVGVLLIDLRTWWLGFGIGYIGVGIVMLIILKLNPPRPTLTMGSGQKYNTATLTDDSIKN